MDWKRELKQTLEKVLWHLPEKSGIIFSGGLDSSLLAYLVNMKDKDTRLYSAGTANSHDFQWTTSASNLLGIPLKFFNITEEEIVESVTAIKGLQEGLTPLSILIEVPLYVVCKHSYDKSLISGQGADELFLGYKKYEKEDSSSADIKNVLNNEVPLEREIARIFGKTILYPYLERSVVKLATKMPFEVKIVGEHRKYVLRQVAGDFGLSEHIAWKPKKAAQYSSGVTKLVRSMALESKKKSHEFIMDL